MGVLLLTAAGIIVKFIGAVYRIVLGNLPGFGDVGMGLYGSAYQVYLVLFALSTTGFPSAIAKLVAEKTALGDRRGAHRIFRVAFALMVGMGAVIMVGFFFGSGWIAHLISMPDTEYTMMALAPTVFFVAVMSVYRGYFQGMQDMTPQANSQVIEQVGKGLFAIILGYTLLPYGVIWSAAGATFGTTAGAIIGAIYLWNLYNRRKKELWRDIRNSPVAGKPDPAWDIIKRMVKLAIPISLGSILSLIHI